MCKQIILAINVILALNGLEVKSQDTTIFFCKTNTICNKSNAFRYSELKKVDNKKFEMVDFYRGNNTWVKDFNRLEFLVKTDSSFFVKKYRDTTIIDTWIREYKREGQFYVIKDYSDKRDFIRSQCNSQTVFPLKILDSLTTYFENGQIYGISYYENYTRVRWREWDKNGNEGIENVYRIAEEMASFPNGEEALFKFLGENVKYPKKARKRGVSGVVYATFIIMEDGSLKDIKILRGIGGGCDDELLRVIKLMPNWIPAKMRGESVRQIFNLPMKFSE